MDAFPCSPYPHHTWLAQWIAIQPPCIFDIVVCRHVTHHIMLTVAGAADVLCSGDGAKITFHTSVGHLGFFPCDRGMHSLAITSAGAYGRMTCSFPTTTSVASARRKACHTRRNFPLFRPFGTR